MSGRKKKLTEETKNSSISLITILIVLMILMGVFLVWKMVYEEDYYSIESRDQKIAESRNHDGRDYGTIGWVRVQGTNIDYPLYGVIQEGYEYPVVDSYLWSLNMDSEFHDMMLVYGHNVMNLGPNPIRHSNSFIRMEELMNFVYFDFAQNNEYIQLTINGEDYLYKIFAVNFMKVDDLEEYPEGDWSPNDKKGYVKRLLEESIYDYDVEVLDDEKIISVVTCSRFFTDGTNYDFIVSGRLVRPKEEVKQYSVYRNKNYELIAEVMKGAEEDEESTENA